VNYHVIVPHFEWLGLARSDPSAAKIWARVLLAVVVGWIIVVAIVLLVR